MSSRRRPRRTSLTPAILASAVFAAHCPAATQHWVGDQDYPELFPLTAGSFFNAGMWRADLHVPLPADDALFGVDPDFPYTSPNGNDQFAPFTIYFGDFAQRDPVTDESVFLYPGGSATVTNLFVTTGAWTFNFGSGSSRADVPPPSTGSLHATNYLAVGYNSNFPGPASLTCTGGSSLQVHDLKLGFSAGDTGTLTLTGGTSLTLDTYGSVGYHGAGTLNISDGSTLSQSSTSLYVGDADAASSGAVYVTGPSTSLHIAGTLFPGNVGSGSVSLSAGARASASTVTIANAAGSHGSVSVSDPGTTLAVVNSIYIGNSGTATFSQSDGLVSLGLNLSLGQRAGSDGTLLLSGGTLTGATTCFVGNTGSGTLTQSGGSLAIVGNLNLGGDPAGSGRYTLSGGSVSAAASYVGGRVFNANGTGTFAISGGAASFPGPLKVYDRPGNALSLSSGSLSVGSLDTDGNPARFAWTGGTLSITNSPLSLSPTGPLGPSLTLSPAMTLLLAQPLTLSNGTLDLTSSNLTLPASVTVSSGSIAASTGSLTAPSFTFSGAASASAQLAGAASTLTKTGPSTVTLTGPNSYTGLTTVAAGTLTLGRHAWTPVLLSAGADITAGKLLFDYTGTSSPLASVESRIRSGDIRSSAADPTHTLGTLDDPASSSVTVAYTLTGDANLDGQLTPDDYALLDRGFAIHGTHWSQGDFNYSGTITPADYLLIDTAYLQQQGGTPSPAFLSQRESQFGPAYVSTLLASVPEPSLTLFAACGLALPYLRRPRTLKIRRTFQ